MIAWSLRDDTTMQTETCILENITWWVAIVQIILMKLSAKQKLKEDLPKRHWGSGRWFRFLQNGIKEGIYKDIYMRLMARKIKENIIDPFNEFVETFRHDFD